MRAAGIAVIVLAVLVSTSAVAQELPEFGKSAVSIPWEDFKAILEKLQAPRPPEDPQPPVDYTLGRGSLTGTLDQGRLEITTTYPLSVLKKGWVVIPLVGTYTPLANVLIDGKTAPVTDREGKVALVVKGPATHTLTLEFRVTAVMRPGPGSVSLELPQAAGQVLRLKVGPKLSGVTVDGATMSTDDQGRVTAILTGDSLTARYTVAMEKKEDAREKLPPKVLVENSTLVSIDEGFIRAIVQLAYEVRHAPVSEFKLRIPEGFDVADCTGASLAGWKIDENSRVLTATVGFEVSGAYSLTLVLERSTKQESFSFPVPEVQAVEVERERGFFAVQVTGGVEVTVAEQIEGLQLVDAKELPSGLRSGATNPIVLSFKYLRHPFAADLKVVRHETQPVLGAAIDTANYVMQITEDGDCVTRAVYTVRNNRKQFLEITLPHSEKIALWSSFVAGKPVKPSKTKQGKILLPLEKSSYAGSDLTSFTVEVIFYSNLGSSLRPIGALDIAMPEVDLPISRSMLSVFGPTRFTYSRIAGSMRGRYEPISPLLQPLRKAAKRAQEPMMDRLTGYAGYDEAVEGELEVKEESFGRLEMQQAEAEKVFRKKIRAAQQVQDVSGALPARFMVPEEGTSLRFTELITIGEASSLTLGYASRKLSGALALLTLLITLALAWYATRKGTALFVLGVAAIVVLVASGVSVGWVVLGAVIGIIARLVHWISTRKRQEPKQADPI